MHAIQDITSNMEKKLKDHLKKNKTTAIFEWPSTASDIKIIVLFSLTHT